MGLPHAWAHRAAWGAVAAAVAALALTLAHCGEFSEDPAGDAGDAGGADGAGGGGDGGSVDDAQDGCSRVPYTVGQVVERGSVCGFGACRVVLSGACPKDLPDGAIGTVCDRAFPVESCTTPIDDNCDGVLDEGCEGAATAAGTQCIGCAVGRTVKRGADGTIAGQSGNYQDNFSTTDCINTALCGLGEPRWVKNMKGASTTCTKFCADMGGACEESCTTSQPPCAPPAASVNQGGQRFGTYTADYGCMEMGSNQAITSTPNTGDCKFIPKNNGYGPVADNRFSYMCCCKL